MYELSLTINDPYYIEPELKEYLLTHSEIEDVNISNNEIYIKYNNKILITILIKEIQLFLNSLNTPFILSFDKHSDKILKEYKICIKDLCCEYCLMGTIEDLLYKEGIISASTDFDFINKKNVSINITYDNSIITEKEILEIEKELNFK